MTNWLTTREAVQRAASIEGDGRITQIDLAIEAASRDFESRTRRYFIPRTETRLYRWPQPEYNDPAVLWLDQDLISVTTLQTKAQDASPTTISSSDYFLEPGNTDPPNNRIEIDESSTAVFEAGATSQRSISVAGSWGYHNNTRSAGTVDGAGLASSASATSFACSDSSLIGVGDTLLIESEQVFVSGRSYAALGSILIDGALTATKNQVTITVDTSHGIIAGEIIMVDSEQMLVQSTATTTLSVIRAYNGTTLAAHSDDSAIQVNRTLTIERGVNGTTAATHADTTAISVYEPPADVQRAVRATALAALAQEAASYGRQIGAGDGAVEFTGRGLMALWEDTVSRYLRVRMATI